MGGRRVSNFAYNSLTMSYMQPPIYAYYTNDAEFKMYHAGYQSFTKYVLIDFSALYCINYILYSFIPVIFKVLLPKMPVLKSCYGPFS